jgi:hypothetical protein
LRTSNKSASHGKSLLMIEFHAEEIQTTTQHGLHQFMSEDLVRGVRFRVWDVEANNIQYQYNDGHTLSLYLKGGERTFRNHKPHLKGQTGKLCLMPQGHLSHWHSPKPIRIAHLYLPWSNHSSRSRETFGYRFTASKFTRPCLPVRCKFKQRHDEPYCCDEK